MSDAETEWANQQEWRAEREAGFDIEINQRRPTEGDFGCEKDGCTNPGKTDVEVKYVTDHAGMWITFCADHDDDDNAYEIFHEREKDSEGDYDEDY